MKYAILLFCLSWLSLAQAQDPATPNSPTSELTQPELDSFHEEALKRIQALETYIQTIADKKRDDIERNDAIKQATKMFVNGATIEVSRSGKGSSGNATGSISPPIPIAKYFQRLKNLTYDRVKITNFNAARLSEWKKQNDGSYQAVGQYFQSFQAWRDKNGGRPIVDHKDRKKIDVDLRMREDPFYKEKSWMVLFENITIDAVGEAAMN